MAASRGPPRAGWLSPATRHLCDQRAVRARPGPLGPAAPRGRPTPAAGGGDTARPRGATQGTRAREERLRTRVLRCSDLQEGDGGGDGSAAVGPRRGPRKAAEPAEETHSFVSRLDE